MLRRPLFSFVNHLLTAESWAQARLKSFAGQHARFEIGPLAQSVAVNGDGTLLACDGTVPPAVTIRLPADAVWQLLMQRGTLFSSARIEGAADFAESLGFVVRNLRWDIEADLAHAIGDIPAHRLTTVIRRLSVAGEEASSRLMLNIEEYVGEAAIGVRQEERAAFRQEVEVLNDALHRLENRLEKLA